MIPRLLLGSALAVFGLTIFVFAGRKDIAAIVRGVRARRPEDIQRLRLLSLAAIGFALLMFLAAFNPFVKF